MFDAVVHIGGLPPGVDLGGALEDRPVVVVQGGTELAGVDRVDDDVVEAVVLVARHLTVMGRMRPVLLGPDRARRSDDDPDRPSRAMRGALASAGIDADAVLAVTVGRTADRGAGAAAAAAVLDAMHDVDALLCVNDEVALGALHVLAARGLDVPGRVAVIGYDNLDDGRFSAPALTTVDPGPQRLARVALELLADRLEGTAPPHPRVVTSPVDLVRRESTLGEVLR